MAMAMKMAMAGNVQSQPSLSAGCIPGAARLGPGPNQEPQPEHSDGNNTENTQETRAQTHGVMLQ